MENEALLFKKMQLGDWTAFNLFFKEYMEQLYLYAVAFVKDRAAAEDIVQDSFIYLWTNRGKINFTGSIYAYLLLAVKNACINYKAHQQVEEKYRATFQADGTTGEGEEEWEELRNRVMRAIDCLPPKCREIFILGAVGPPGRKAASPRPRRSPVTKGRRPAIAWVLIRRCPSRDGTTYWTRCPAPARRCTACWWIPPPCCGGITC